MIMIADIQRAVADEYGLTVAQLREPARLGVQRGNTWDIAHPRQLAMCLATRLTGHSLTGIGRRFGGRDHSTVWAACRAVEKRRARDDAVHDALRRITLGLVRR